MALTAAEICDLARQIAQVDGYLEASGQFLNLVLEGLTDTGDYDTSRGTFNFTFSGATAPIGNLQVQLASGPFRLPADYLRAKRGDIIYFPIQQYPYFLTPVDLEEFDMQVQQAGFQAYPALWATDVAQRRDMRTTTATSAVGDGVLTEIANLSAISVGHGVYGDMIAPGTLTTVSAIDSLNQTVTVTPASNVIAAYPTENPGTVCFAACPIAYVWPPAHGAYPCMVRYYRRMPPIASAFSSERIPWFPYQDYLIQAVAGRLMKIANDERATAFLGENMPDSAPTMLRKYLQMKDDKTNRAMRIALDPRRFGPSRASLPPSKTAGY